MAERKFQNKPEGEHDNPHHDGFHANEKRKEAARQALIDYLEEMAIEGMSISQLIDMAAQIHDWDGQLEQMKEQGFLGGKSTSLINERTIFEDTKK